MGGAIGEQHSDEKRLTFEDLGTQIRTRVTRVSEHGLTVEQALPFLRLHGRVHDEAMRAAEIRSVSMVVYDGMPRLVLDLAYEPVQAFGAADAAASDVVPSSALPARDAHVGVARARRRDDTVGYETSAVAAAAAPDGDPAALALTVPGEVPNEDRTRLFRTLPPSQMTLEEQMLRSGQLSFRLHRQWEQLRPGLQSAGIRLWMWGKRADAVLRPWLARAARLGLAGGRSGLRLARATALRVVATIQARRAARAQRLASRTAEPAPGIDAAPAGASLAEHAPVAES